MKLYKALLAALVMSASATALTSCDDNFDYPPVVSPDLGGNGAWDAPLTVDGGIAYYTAYYSDAPDANKYYWVRGFIVGCVQTTETVFTATDQTVNMTGNFTTPNNILLATTPDETDYNNCIALQLPSGAVRSALNLQDNPANLGKEVCVRGYIDKYLGLPGLRSLSAYNWGSEGIDTGDVETASSVFTLASELKSGRSYALVANGTAANTVDGDNGFLKTESVSISGGKFTATEKYGFLITETAEGSGKYYICDYRGMFLWQDVYGSGWSNRPSVSKTILKDNNGFVWQIVKDDNGHFTIINEASTRVLAFDTDYKSYGLYASLTSQYLAPELYEMANDPVVVPDFTPGEPGNDTPDTPDVSEGKGEGTLQSPYDAARATAVASALSDGQETAEVYVEGIVSSIKELSTSFGNATYYISADGSTTGQFYVYRGYYLDGAKFTSESQLKVGDKVVVCGKLTNYKGNSPQLSQGNKLVSINGEGGSTTTPDTPGDGDGGNGQEATPYNPAQIIAMNPTSTTAAVESGVWVEGYIVGSMPTGGDSTTLSGTEFSTANAATTNMVIGPTADCTDYSKCIGIQLPSGAVRNALNLSVNPGNLGMKVKVYGDVMKYCGGPGIKNTSKYVLGEGGSTTPDTPDTPSADAKGDGTEANPYNAVAANRQAAALADGQESAEVYVEGTISSIKEVSTQFGNATYYISVDGSTADQFYVYRGYYLNGDKFTAEDQLKVGDKVVVYGKLTNYKGNSPQLSTGNKLISINGQK